MTFILALALFPFLIQNSYGETYDNVPKAKRQLGMVDFLPKAQKQKLNLFVPDSLS